MTRYRKNLAGIALTGLLLMGVGCSSSTDEGAPTTGNRVTSSTSSGSKSPSPSVYPPKEVPDGIAMPEGIEMGPWQESKRAGKRVLTIAGTIRDAEGQGPDVFKWITGSLIDMGYTLEYKTEGKRNGTYAASVRGVEEDHTVTVAVSEVGPDIRVDYVVVPDS